MLQTGETFLQRLSPGHQGTDDQLVKDRPIKEGRVGRPPNRHKSRSRANTRAVGGCDLPEAKGNLRPKEKKRKDYKLMQWAGGEIGHQGGEKSKKGGRN